MKGIHTFLVSLLALLVSAPLLVRNANVFLVPTISGNMPEEVCMLSAGNLESFTTDCPGRMFGVLCPIPTCCSACVEYPVPGEDEDEEAEP